LPKIYVLFCKAGVKGFLFDGLRVPPGKSPSTSFVDEDLIIAELFIVHCSSFIVHRSSFIVHRSSFIVHRSSFIVPKGRRVFSRYSSIFSKEGLGRRTRPEKCLASSFSPSAIFFMEVKSRTNCRKASPL